MFKQTLNLTPLRSTKIHTCRLISTIIRIPQHAQSREFRRIVSPSSEHKVTAYSHPLVQLFPRTSFFTAGQDTSAPWVASPVNRCKRAPQRDQSLPRCHRRLGRHLKLSQTRQRQCPELRVVAVEEGLQHRCIIPKANTCPIAIGRTLHPTGCLPCHPRTLGIGPRR